MGMTKIKVGGVYIPLNPQGDIERRPVGEITIWPTATLPTGWLLCDGSAVSRTTYADLFARIGTTYGAGDGSTTFNLPNFKGKMPVGFDAAQTEFNTLGKSLGAKTVVLDSTQIPSHTHTGTTGGDYPDHTHKQAVDSSYNAAAGGVAGRYADNNTGTNRALAGLDSGPASARHFHDFTTNPTGGGLAHENMPPYITTNWMIRYVERVEYPGGTPMMHTHQRSEVSDLNTLVARERAQHTMTGGGTISLSSATDPELKWSQRIVVIGVGRGTHFGTEGLFNIDVPSVGTSITGVGGATNQAVTTNGIPIPWWHALYYIPPVGGPSASVPANFRIVSYTSDFVVPDHWIFLAGGNPENTSFRLFNGVHMARGQTWQAVPTWNVVADRSTSNPDRFQGNWGHAIYSSYPDTRYIRDSARNVEIRGSLWEQYGTANGTVVFNLPVGYRPATYFSTLITHTGSQPALARLDVNTDGNVVCTRISGSDPGGTGYSVAAKFSVI